MSFIFSIIGFLSALLSLSSFASAELICGTLGYHNETALSYYMGNFFYNGLSTFTLCAAWCKQDTKCEAFRYSYWMDSNAQYCEFFNTSIDRSFTADSTSLYYYYDIGCNFPEFETPVTSFSTLDAVTITSFDTITSTLPAITTTTTVAITTTKTASTISTTTQTLAAQVRTITSSSIVTVTATARATTSITVSATRTAFVTTTAPTMTKYLTRTITATYFQYITRAVVSEVR
ncbi:hypothetical protein EJ07DRAFT_158902 [Lizonia empirigonia]|nr:hypothetical protein EJ07DRAFT_158902 [Lizonia empirigonia]